VGAFSKREAADALLGTLKGSGYAAVLSEADVTGRHWFRVRIPVSGERAAADALAAKLRGQNLPAQVFPGAP
jgi:cell division protein FtsN